jgi:hypothetical protein
MAEFPAQVLLQQRRARPISGEQLEVMGKRAASRWCDGQDTNLTSAVTYTIKSADVALSPEQVRRVVEFANTDAYLREFRKEGGSHKIIDFGSDGPANPADVLRDLNDGGGRTVMDSGLGDYRLPPADKYAQKDEADDALEEAFMGKAASVGYPEVNPLGEVVELQEKLAAAQADVSSQINSLEVAYLDLSGRLYGLVKQAALEGRSLGEIVQAWSSVSEDPAFVKAAFDQFTPRFFNEGVFRTLNQMGDSIVKTASAGYVNQSHPLVTCYRDFCSVLTKLAELRVQQEDLLDGHKKLSYFLKHAVGKQAGVAQVVKGGLDKAVAGAQKHLGVSSRAAKGMVYGPAALAVLGAGKYIGDAANDYGLSSVVPGTVAYDQRRGMRRPLMGPMAGAYGY